ncbi:MAG: ACT domain-containing protein [Candidatus Omnitrophica bacterium]|nr:ACT domain-containing protein [Candidatus Omnitrophota bacterium]
MAKATLAKQLTVETENKVGMLAELTGTIADAGVNITAICAYGMENKAIFMLISSDNNKAKGVLAQKGYKVEEGEVVTVMLEDKVGQAKGIADKIKAAGINLDYLYGTTCGCTDSPALMVIGSKENAKVVSVVNG